MFTKIGYYVDKIWSSLWHFLTINFTDRAGRIDTGRIGQFVGLGSLTTILYFECKWFYLEQWDYLENMLVLTGASAVPMLLYRAKTLLGSDGTAVVRKEVKVRSGFFGKLVDAFLRNILDQYGRIDTGRIGNFVGLAATAFVLYVTLDRLLFQKVSVPGKYLTLIAGPSGFAMLMYRVKTLSKIISGVKEYTERESLDSDTATGKIVIDRLPKEG